MKRGSREVFEELVFGPLESHDGPAILGDEVVTYPELLRRADELGRRLRAAGIDESMRVGICFEPSAAYVVALLGVLRVGAKALLLSPKWTPDEVRRCIDLIQPACVVSGQAVDGVDSRAAPFALGLGMVAADLRHDGLQPSLPSDAVVIFTSGTSGVPKGVVLSAEGLVANARAVREYLEASEDDSALLFTPTCYAYAVSQVLVQVLARAAICPSAQGLKYPIALLEAIARHRLRGLSANPTSFKMLLAARSPSALDLSSLRYAQMGGQALSAELVGAVRDRFPNAGVVNVYGTTENGPRISFHWVRDGERPLPGCSLPVGKAVSGTELEIAKRTASGSGVGEVLIRGTSMMDRYWNMADYTASRLVDGWFTTGDLGRFDADGNLVLVGRLSDVINVGNEKVTPGEVEAWLERMPGVAEAAVYGVADPLLGESVEAILVLEPGVPLDEGALTRAVRNHLRGVLSAYKIPRRVHVRPDLPRTLYGKLDRKRLAAWAAAAP